MGALSPSGDYLRTSAENGATVSRCVYCQQIVGAGKQMAKVEIAENTHECPGKREERDGADAYSTTEDSREKRTARSKWTAAVKRQR